MQQLIALCKLEPHFQLHSCILQRMILCASLSVYNCFL